MLDILFLDDEYRRGSARAAFSGNNEFSYFRGQVYPKQASSGGYLQIVSVCGRTQTLQWSQKYPAIFSWFNNNNRFLEHYGPCFTPRHPISITDSCDPSICVLQLSYLALLQAIQNALIFTLLCSFNLAALVFHAVAQLARIPKCIASFCTPRRCVNHPLLRRQFEHMWLGLSCGPLLFDIIHLKRIQSSQSFDH